MATVRKFTFDTRFDDPEPGRPTLGQALAGDHPAPRPGGNDPAPKAEAPPPAPEPEPEPDPEPEPEDSGPPLVYTEEDMEIAREEAYVAGHTAALDEAQVAAERAAAEALQLAAEELRALAAGVGEAHAAYAELAARVATEVCRRFLPETGDDYAVNEIAGLMRGLMPNLIGQPRLIVRCHPDVREAVQRALGHTADQTGFEGRLTVIGDPAFAYSDCRIEWGEGGAERNTTRLWAEIDELVERNLPLFKRSEALEVEEEAPPPPPEPEDVWPEDVDTAAHWTPSPPAPQDAETDADAEVNAEVDAEVDVEAEAEVDTETDVDTEAVTATSEDDTDTTAEPEADDAASAPAPDDERLAANVDG